METVAGLFRDARSADRAVDALKEAGFSDSVSVIAREQVIKENIEGSASRAGDADLTEAPEVETSGLDSEIARSSGAGAVGGGIIGGIAGLLVGIGALVVPGLGPVLAAGGITAALTGGAAGAAIGATGGGIIGALVGMGFKEEHANVYAEGVRRGAILVVAHAKDGQGDLARTIMNNAGAVNIDETSAEWRAGGWNQFDEQRHPDDDIAGAWGKLSDQR